MMRRFKKSLKTPRKVARCPERLPGYPRSWRRRRSRNKPVERTTVVKAFFTLVLLLLAGTPALAAQSDAALRSALATDLANYLASRGRIEHISTASLSINLPNAASNINVAVGTMQYGGGKPVTPDNLFQIGSNTKAFTSSIL